MAINLLFHKAITGQIGEVELDARLSENHLFRSLVTRHPIESGAKISDHIVNDPETVTMFGFITNSPVRLGGRIGQSVVDSLNGNPDSGDDRVKSAFTALTDLWELKQSFTVITGLKTYRNMVFQSLEFPVDSKTGDSLRFISTITRIPRVSSQTVPIENLSQDTDGVKSGTKDTAASNVDKSKQSTTAATDAQEQSSTLAFKIAKSGQKTAAELADTLAQLIK